MTLALLICHLPQRASLLERLRDRLGESIELARAAGVPDAALVQIHVHGDPNPTTGEKRNRLLQTAAECKADYVAFIDDDDLVSPDYCSQVLTALQEGPDVVGLEGLLHRPTHQCEKFIHSRRYSTWSQSGDLGHRTYYRCPNHLNPVRLELAIAAGFPDLTRGEDMDYSHRLLPLLKTEVMLEEPAVQPLYHYFAR